MFTSKRAVVLVASLAALLAGCSGGGSGSTPTPTSSNPYGGLGVNPTFDQKVNFTVIVPPQAALLTARSRAKRRSSSSTRRSSAAATSSNPYVSPNVASVSFQIESVDGFGVRNAPAAVLENVSCGSTTSGCSVPIQGIAAAKGTNLFLVQTFSGPGGHGNLVSSGSISVSVPSAQAISFGGTTISVGGLVQAISLAAVIPGGSFNFNTPASGSLVVNAVDSAGAVIVGSDVLASPITVTFPQLDGGDFTFAGTLSTVVPNPTTLAFAYNGNPIASGSVTAATVDFNANPLSTSIPLPVTAPATMKPGPPPVAPASSLYVLDSPADRIIEYAGISALEGGGSLAPQRVIDIAQPAATLSSITCPAPNMNTPIASAFAVRSDGSIYVQTLCYDTATSSINYVFVYPPGSVDTVTPSGQVTPPSPSATIAINTNLPPIDVKLDEASGQLLVEYVGGNVIGVDLANPSTVATNFGSYCIGLVGGSCESSGIAFAISNTDFDIDGHGQVLLPSSNGATFPLPEPVSEQLSGSSNGTGEAAVAEVAEGTFSAQPAARAALSGYTSELGSIFNQLSVDGPNLYVLGTGSAITQPQTQNVVYPGLSGCPPPSPIVAIPNGAANCVVGSQTYLIGFLNFLPTFSLSGTGGQDANTAPTFMLGGDSVGKFPISDLGLDGDTLVVRNGYAFILDENVTPSVVKVYDTNNITIFTTDTGPLQSVPFPATVMPTSLVIAPTSATTGGTSTLARRARVHHDMKAYARMRASLLKQHAHVRRS